MCEDCFLVFPKKFKQGKCPACTQEILTFGPNQESYSDLLELNRKNGEAAETELDLIGETLDHQYFLEEIKKIL